MVTFSVVSGAHAAGLKVYAKAAEFTPGAPATAAAFASAWLFLTAMVRAASLAAWVTEIWAL